MRCLNLFFTLSLGFALSLLCACNRPDQVATEGTDGQSQTVNQTSSPIAPSSNSPQPPGEEPDTSEEGGRNLAEDLYSISTASSATESGLKPCLS